jgi:flagellar biosynthesis protein FlhF
LVGPSGSGKSSCIAKVAALAQQKTQKKILVVSFDNKRLGAREQLRVITKVLGLSFETIEEAAQLQEVLQKHRDWDLCFVDTSAECPRSTDDISDFMVLKDLDLPLKFHLCLSITEKEAQLDRMIRGFSPLGLESVVFSRLDESWSYGEIFNLCLRWSLPLSYFGVGRDIPSDLERASRERVMERIFGL